MDRNKNMTVIVDASHCPNTGAAGWGGFARKDGWPSGIFQGQPFKAPLSNATEAELCAVANWLEKLQRENHMEDVERIILQTDCLAALNIILGNCMNAIPVNAQKHGICIINPDRRSSSNMIEQALTLIKNTIPIEVTIWLKHVKGHQGRNKDARFTVNEICDTEAKKHMCKMRRDLNVAKHPHTETSK